MDTAQALKQEASWVAWSLNGNARTLDPDISLRFASYRPQADATAYLCPRCWMRDGVRSSLRSVPGGDDHDLLRCNDDRCGAEFVIPF